MSNSNLKGRATAAFAVTSVVTNNVMTLTVTADVTDIDDTPTLHETVRGTVALGKAIAEHGKVATPITAAERKFNAQVALYVEAGLDADEATNLASKVSAI